MFILYAVPIGLALGFLLGGRPAGLATLQFRFGWVMVAGLLVQVVRVDGRERLGRRAGCRSTSSPRPW